MATSVRAVPAKLLEINRQILNNQPARSARTTAYAMRWVKLTLPAPLRASLGHDPVVRRRQDLDRLTRLAEDLLGQSLGHGVTDSRSAARSICASARDTRLFTVPTGTPSSAATAR